MNATPRTAEDLAHVVRSSARVLAIGGGTKPALAQPAAHVVRLDVRGVAGIVEYDPAEYTVTALAGTRVADVAALLASHGQALPFDPPFVAAGATLGGTVAAGVSGSGRWRYGGVRDFIVGVRFVDGEGRLLRGGARVVKNAAGFDFPKLFVGSAGRLGVLAEITFKVFPKPEATATVRARMRSANAAFDALSRLSMLPIACDVLDLEATGVVALRVGGPPAAVTASVQRIRAALAPLAEDVDALVGEDDERHWNGVREFTWASGTTLVKAPTTWRAARALEPALAAAGAPRRYAACANVAWIGWPAGRRLDELDAVLRVAGVAGVVLRHAAARGEPPLTQLGARRDDALFARVRRAMDPTGRFDV